MNYTVYENGKPAILWPSNFKEWDNATFSTKRDAEVYAYLWCYPVTKPVADKEAPEMEVGKKYDYSMCEVPLWMHIEEHD